MTIHTEENRVRPAVRVLRRLRSTGAGDDGISLLEVVVSLVILAVVMASAAGFFINGLRTTGGQSSRQAAISLTNEWLEKVNAISPKTPAGGISPLLAGRSSGAVTALLATDTGSTLTGRDDTSNSTSASYDYDPTATTASTPAVPTGAPSTACSNKLDPNYNCTVEGNVTYQTRTFIDPCWLPTGTATSTNPTRSLACVGSSTVPSGATGVSMEYRVTVVTSWKGGASTNCANGCSFNDSTLIDPHGDAVFNSNISKPTLTGASPSPVGGNSTPTLTLTGTNFVAGATITISCDTCTATPGTVSSNTGSSLKVPVTFGPAGGTATIRLTNPDGGTATTTLTVDNAPTVATYSPSSVPNGSPTTVTFTGTNLSAGTTVTASGGTVASAAYSAGQITFQYTGTSSTPSPVFTVTNADGGIATVTGLTVGQSKPVITAVSPGTIHLGTTGGTYTYTVTGTGFVASPLPQVTLTLNGYAAYNALPPSVVSPTSYSFQLASGPTTPQGTYLAVYTITNADGGTTSFSTTLVITS